MVADALAPCVTRSSAASYMRKDFNYLCHVSVEEWSINHRYMFVFLLKKLAFKRVNNSVLCASADFNKWDFSFTLCINLVIRHMTSLLSKGTHKTSLVISCQYLMLVKQADVIKFTEVRPGHNYQHFVGDIFKYMLLNDFLFLFLFFYSNFNELGS